jgi:hypothetical protein
MPRTVNKLPPAQLTTLNIGGGPLGRKLRRP